MVFLFLLCAVVVGIFLSCQRQVFLPSVVVELLSAEEQAHQSYSEDCCQATTTARAATIG